MTCCDAPSWRHWAEPYWSSQWTLESAVTSSRLSIAGCQDWMLSQQARAVHDFVVCSQYFPWQLILLAKISGMNFVRFNAIITPMQISMAWADLGHSAGWIPGWVKALTGIVWRCWSQERKRKKSGPLFWNWKSWKALVYWIRKTLLILWVFSSVEKGEAGVGTSDLVIKCSSWVELLVGTWISRYNRAVKRARRAGRNGDPTSQQKLEPGCKKFTLNKVQEKKKQKTNKVVQNKEKALWGSQVQHPMMMWSLINYGSNLLWGQVRSGLPWRIKLYCSLPF